MDCSPTRKRSNLLLRIDVLNPSGIISMEKNAVVNKPLKMQVTIRLSAAIERSDIIEDHERIVKAHLPTLVAETVKIVAEEVKKALEHDRKKKRVFAE